MSDSLGFGIFSLQSGFVVAVLIGGLLLAERLGGDEGFARKATLAAVAIALALLVTSATTAFLRPPDVPEDINFFSSSSSQSDQAQAELLDYSKASTRRASDAGSIHVGIGILLALTGGLFIRRWRALGLGILLGGVLLLLLGAVPSTESLYSSIYSVHAAPAGQLRDIARFVVLLVGTLALLLFAYWRWDRPTAEIRHAQVEA